MKQLNIIPRCNQIVINNENNKSLQPWEICIQSTSTSWEEVRALPAHAHLFCVLILCCTKFLSGTYHFIHPSVFYWKIFHPTASALFLFWSYDVERYRLTNRWKKVVFLQIHHHIWRVHEQIFVKFVLERERVKWNKLYFVVELLRHGAGR